MYSGAVQPAVVQHDDPLRLYHPAIPRNHFQLGGFQLKDRDLPRGKFGIDGLEKLIRDEAAARDAAEAAQKRVVAAADRAAYAEDLDALVRERDVLLAMRRRADELAGRDTGNFAYGGGAVEDRKVRTAAELKRRRQEELALAWAQQKADKVKRELCEKDFLSRPPEDWDAALMDLDRRTAIAMGRYVEDDSRKAADVDESEADRQVVAAAREAAEAKERARDHDPYHIIATGVVSDEVLGFADRIVATSRAKKEKQAAFRASLDAQVDARAAQRRQAVTENFLYDRSFHHPFLPDPSLQRVHEIEQIKAQEQFALTQFAIATSATTRRAIL
jgi:hypothetical protein